VSPTEIQTDMRLLASYCNIVGLFPDFKEQFPLLCAQCILQESQYWVEM